MSKENSKTSKRRHRKIAGQIRRLLVNKHLPPELYNSIADGLDKLSEATENNASFEFLTSKKRIKTILRDLDLYRSR